MVAYSQITLKVKILTTVHYRLLQVRETNTFTVQLIFTHGFKITMIFNLKGKIICSHEVRSNFNCMKVTVILNIYLNMILSYFAVQFNLGVNVV